MKDAREEDFIRFARQTLEQDLQGMGATTCSRLAHTREQAVATATHRWRMRMSPLGASIGIAAAATLLIFLWPVAQSLDTRQLALEDIDILASDADMDVLVDPNFYRWLEQNNHAG